MTYVLYPDLFKKVNGECAGIARNFGHDGQILTGIRALKGRWPNREPTA